MADAALERVLGGRFRIDALLGRGGMGSVYLATDLSIGRQVAIKLLRRELAEDETSLQRMREEAVALASLRHPNVVQLYDFQAGSPDTTFLLMELVRGESLSSRLARGPVAVATGVDYVRQVLSALAAAHAAGIVHRDIKPANVLVVPVAGQRDLVKLLDFGIAKLTEETIRRRPTTAGILIGTPNAMSPEQASGRPVDARSDLYASGLLLYTLLAGANPFKGADLADTLRRVQDMIPTPLAEVRSEVPRALSDVVARVMAKDPAQRFQSAIEMLHALDASSAAASAASDMPTLTGRPQAAREPPTTSVQPAAPPMHSHSHPPSAAPKASSTPVGLILAIVVLGALLVGTVGALAFVLGARTTEAAPVATADTPLPIVDASVVTPSQSASNTAPSPSTSSSKRPPGKKAAGPAAEGPTAEGPRCRCVPTKASSIASRHGMNVALGSSAAQLRCFCVLDGSDLCAIGAVPCASGTPGCGASHFTACTNKTFIAAKEDLSCSGFDPIGRPATGTAQHCVFPDSVTGYPGPAGQPCEGLTVRLERVRGVTDCL